MCIVIRLYMRIGVNKLYEFLGICGRREGVELIMVVFELDSEIMCRI